MRERADRRSGGKDAEERQGRGVADEGRARRAALQERGEA